MNRDGQAAAGRQAGCFAEMTVADIDLVWAIEQQTYAFPWSRGNFTDSLASGYLACLLTGPAMDGLRRVDRQARCLGYMVAMPGADEMHLLNITVRPEAQGQGHGRALLGELMRRSIEVGAHTLWLEVRESNQRARRLYSRWGFVEVGRRKAYYPALPPQREDAIVMKLALPAAGQSAGVPDALV